MLVGVLGLLKLIAVLSKDGQEVWIRNASAGLNAINTLVERSDMKNRNSAVDELYECLVKMEDMDIVMVDPLENIENIVQYMQEKDRCPEEVQVYSNGCCNEEVVKWNSF